MTTNAHAAAMFAIEVEVAHLSEALDELDRMPIGDQTTTGLMAHALTNYFSVGNATLDLLAETLKDHPDPEVPTWLAGLRHLGDLMQHTMGRLLQVGPPAQFPLRFEAVDVAKLMVRACDYHAGAAQRKRIAIEYRSVDEIPPAWGDRVAVAVLADTLLSHALTHSREDGTIVVQIATGPGGVVSSVCDAGPGPDGPHEPPTSWRGRTDHHDTSETPSARYELSTAHELVARMGGQLWFETLPGGGACFSFRIPYASATQDRRERTT